VGGGGETRKSLNLPEGGVNLKKAAMEVRAGLRIELAGALLGKMGALKEEKEYCEIVANLGGTQKGSL